MADEKKPAEDMENDEAGTETESKSAAENPASETPEEVEAELVDDGSGAASDVTASASADEETSQEAAAEEPEGDAIDAQSADQGAVEVADESPASPGLILFLFFILIAAGMFAIFSMNNRSPDTDPVIAEAPSDVKADAPNATQSADAAPSGSPIVVDAVEAQPDDTAQNIVSEETTETENDADTETSDASTTEVLSQTAEEATAAADNIDADAEETLTSKNTDTAQSADLEAAEEVNETPVAETQDAEGAAELFAADPDNDADGVAEAETQSATASTDVTSTAEEETSAALDPRAAIEALRREAEARRSLEAEGETTSEQASADAIEETTEDGVETVTATITEEQPAGGGDKIANTVVDQTDTTDETVTVAETATEDASEEAAAEETLPATAEADTDASDTETVADSAIAANEATGEESTAETTDISEETAETLSSEIADADQTFADKIANTVSTDTSKIANEVEALKEQLRTETESLSAALSEGRQQTAEQSTRITELRESLERAINERDARASREISEIRNQLDKIQSGGTDIPASRQAAASLALLSVQRAVDDGAPFSDELSVLDRLTNGAASIGPLRDVARDGAPTLAALKIDFEPAVLKALAAAGGEAKGPLGRLQSLVSVRPAKPQAGSRPQDIISRADAKLENDDLGGAVAELEALEDESAEALSTWMDKARLRLAATDAIEELNAALLDEYQN